MARPFTRAQACENRAFLTALRRTGNAREAARRMGASRSRFTGRRARDAAFAADWDAALAFAHARLRAGATTTAPAPAPDRAGDEPRAVRTRSGRLQLRRVQPGRLGRAAEQAFLAALSATANVRLSAAAAGFSHSAFYWRARRNPAFAREMRLALQMGYDRIELALLAGADPASHADDAWRRNDPPAIPPMTVNQALQLLYLHQKQARLEAEPAHIRRRRGETREAHGYRLAAMHEARQQRDREAFLVAEAERRAAGKPWLMGPRDLPELPDLAQVRGWSKANPRGDDGGGEADRALFGGWRLKDWKR